MQKSAEPCDDGEVVQLGKRCTATSERRTGGTSLRIDVRTHHMKPHRICGRAPECWNELNHNEHMAGNYRHSNDHTTQPSWPALKGEISQNSGRNRPLSEDVTARQNFSAAKCCQWHALASAATASTRHHWPDIPDISTNNRKLYV